MGYRRQNMFKPVDVQPLEDYKIWVKYSDGVEGVVSLAHLAGKGVFKAWDENDLFKNVAIDPESHAIRWGELIDICPDNIYFEIKGIKPETYFDDYFAEQFRPAV